MGLKPKPIINAISIGIHCLCGQSELHEEIVEKAKVKELNVPHRTLTFTPLNISVLNWNADYTPDLHNSNTFVDNMANLHSHAL